MADGGSFFKDEVVEGLEAGFFGDATDEAVVFGRMGVVFDDGSGFEGLFLVLFEAVFFVFFASGVDEDAGAFFEGRGFCEVGERAGVEVDGADAEFGVFFEHLVHILGLGAGAEEVDAAGVDAGFVFEDVVVAANVFFPFFDFGGPPLAVDYGDEGAARRFAGVEPCAVEGVGDDGVAQDEGVFFVRVEVERVEDGDGDVAAGGQFNGGGGGFDFFGARAGVFGEGEDGGGLFGGRVVFPDAGSGFVAVDAPE